MRDGWIETREKLNKNGGLEYGEGNINTLLLWCSDCTVCKIQKLRMTNKHDSLRWAIKKILCLPFSSSCKEEDGDDEKCMSPESDDALTV